MTTWVVDQRLTAEEALEFFRDIVDDMDDEALESPISLELTQYRDDYWKMLPPEICCTWSRFRTPPVTWWSNVLEWFLQFKLTLQIILTVRRLLNV